MIKGHGGNVNALAERVGCAVEEIVDMSSNLNPLGPPEGFEKFLAESIKEIRSLPEADAESMVMAFSRSRDIDPKKVAAGNGTTWFIYTIPLALQLRRVLISGPTYSDYRDACSILGIDNSVLLSDEQGMFCIGVEKIAEMAEAFDAVFICNPNNPTGGLLHKESVKALASHCPNTLFVIDESYMPFVNGAEDITVAGGHQPSNLIVLSSVSKIFTLPGLRCGFMTAAPEIIKKVMRFYQPWSVNSLAQKGVSWLFEKEAEIMPFLSKTRQFFENQRRIFFQSLENSNGITLFPSKTSFVLARLDKRITADDLCRYLGDRKILIRNCSNFEGLSNRFVRFSLKTGRLNSQLADFIKEGLNQIDDR